MPTTMKLIAKQILTGNATSVTFSDIPSTFSDLYIVISARVDRSGASSDAIYIGFNGSTANFSARFLQAAGSGVASGTETRYAGNATAATADANSFGNTEIYIPNYAGSTNKSLSTTGIGPLSGPPVMAVTAVLWSNTAAITSVLLAPSIGPNFISGSSFFLYAISRA
jgi:hypothetical protein